MYRTAFRPPRARRAAALLASVVLLGAAAPAHAAGDGDPGGEGSAAAAVLRADLGLALLGGAAEVPLTAVLNEVSAPGGDRAEAAQRALDVTVDGVHGGRPVPLLRADAATARAAADADGARAEVSLTGARVQVPGLPGPSVVEVETVAAEAVCPAGGPPTATARAGGAVTVLGREVTLTLGETSRVRLPGVGEVRLDLAARELTDRTAAASAVELHVSLDPLDLGVAAVDGRIALAEVGCHRPDGAGESGGPGGPGGSAGSGETGERGEDGGEREAAGARPQTGTGPEAGSADVTGPDLAATGGDRTPHLVAGAAVLLAGGVLVLLRRRKPSRPGVRTE